MFRFTTKDVYVNKEVKQFKIVEHPGASAILVVNDDKVLLVEQYRPAANRFMLEIPAGNRRLEESPLDCAKRELEEETGFKAETWKSLGVIYPTPGYTSEVLNLYLAGGLFEGEQRLEEGEELEVKWLPLDSVETMIEDGLICDAKTIIAIYKYILSNR
ncbi:MAG: NUDIX hydrolase [Firmicutes bacterium]|nr:NUDIX hydrolase [Bacillota bacterium]